MSKEWFEAIGAIFCVVVIALGICAFGMSFKSPRANCYALTCEVVEVDNDNDVVTLVDANGNTWEWEGVDDWKIGDCASLLMDNNGTGQIADDEILSMTHNAWELN